MCFHVDWNIFVLEDAEGDVQRVEEWEVEIWLKRGYEVKQKMNMRPGRI